MRLPQAGPQRCSKGLGLALTALLHVGAAWQALQGQALFPLHLRGMRQMSGGRGCNLGPLPALSHMAHPPVCTAQAPHWALAAAWVLRGAHRGPQLHGRLVRVPGPGRVYQMLG